MVAAVAYCRSGQGPALVHGHVTRPYSHSLSDDERAYRAEAELEADALRDPIAKFAAWLISNGVLDAEALKALETAVDEEVNTATDRALAAAPPPATQQEILRHVYSEDLPATAAVFDKPTEATPKADAAERTMLDLINAACATKWPATPALSSSAKTSPTPPATPSCARATSRARAESSRSPTACRKSSATTACGTRRLPKPTSPVAPSAWLCAA